MTLTAERRAHLVSIGRLGGLSAAARIDTRARAEAGYTAFRAGFAFGHGCTVCPRVDIPTDLHDEERLRRADQLVKVHYSRLARARTR